MIPAVRLPAPFGMTPLTSPTPWLNRTTLGVSLASLWLVFLFICSGVYIAAEEVAEKAYAASLLPIDRRGTGMGLLAATNGVGDMVSSALVGTLWALFPENAWGFGLAGALQLAGALRIGFARVNHGQGE